MAKEKKVKLVEPKKPTKPYKPTKPEEPKEKIVSSGCVYLYDGMSLKELLDELPEDMDPTNTEMKIELDYLRCYYNYDNPSIDSKLTYTAGLVKNPRYKRELVWFEKKMKTYEKKMAQYEEKMEVYKAVMKQYEIDKSKYDEEKARIDITELKAKLAILEGFNPDDLA